MFDSTRILRNDWFITFWFSLLATLLIYLLLLKLGLIYILGLQIVDLRSNKVFPINELATFFLLFLNFFIPLKIPGLKTKISLFAIIPMIFIVLGVQILQKSCIPTYSNTGCLDQTLMPLLYWGSALILFLYSLFAVKGLQVIKKSVNHRLAILIWLTVIVIIEEVLIKTWFRGY